MKAKTMQGKNIQVHLFTPILLTGRIPDSDEAVSLQVVRLDGGLKEFHDGGILVEVRQAFAERAQVLAPQEKMIFLPFHKVDHILLA